MLVKQAKMSGLDLFFDSVPEFKEPFKGLVGRVNPGGLWQPVNVNLRRQL